MSNSEDEKMIEHTTIYHKALKQLQEQNVETAKAQEQWRTAEGPKPTEEYAVGKILTDREIHEQATQTADRAIEEQQKLKEAGLEKAETVAEVEQHEQGQGKDQDQSHGYGSAREIMQQKRDQSRRQGR